MSGGLLQLVAYGAQDVYLTGNPQITFFKVVYRRHTNFSIEAIEHSFTGSADFGKKVSVEVKRNGDLITKVYLRVRLSDINYTSDKMTDITKFAWVRKLGNAMIDYIECIIGGSRIDKQYGYWMNVWHELADDVNLDGSYNKMVGDVPELTDFTGMIDDSGLMKRGAMLFIPLRFWFCRNNGLALPLIALQYHEVQLDFSFRDFEECCIFSGGFNPRTHKGTFDDATLLVDYIYLDTEERRRFAQVGHEYLIEQLQFTGEESVNANSSKFQLHFSHPVKMLVWNMHLGNYVSGKKFMAYTGSDNWASARAEMAEKLVAGLFAVDANGYLITNLNTATVDPEIYLTLSDSSSPTLAEAIKGLPTGTHAVTTAYMVKSTVKYVEYSSTVDLRSLVDGYASATYTVDAEAQVKITGLVTRNDLTIAHMSRPVDKYLTDNRNTYIVNQDIAIYQHHNNGLYIDGTVNPTVKGIIQLNGHDRFDEREGDYFNYVQPFQHCKRTPSAGVNVYSFALEPMIHQPSGTCNFSRIDTANLNVWYEDTTITPFRDFTAGFLGDETKMWIWAVNYNVLRIMSGMGGLAYAS